MSDWALLVAVLASLASLGTLAHRVIVQIVGRIDSSHAALADELMRRFDAAEASRHESDAISQERLRVRDEAIHRLAEQLTTAIDDHRRLDTDIAAVRREIAEHRTHAAHAYVTRETYLEAEGRNFIKLEKILDRLNQLDNRAHG